ncbi:hypothetical protein SKAU_G00266060 [Synaphobranchus kaupii]|uniref:ZP domain-containing protein n=1 Tax=Synaphobranchus kaupii TaxID=118154 RepID=A0A9Q1IPV9_SYNKA|nr:hypothetical protein SKAU_G00266060 [Synaphobranchus kaupii]
MWLLTVFSLLILGGISPTLSVGNANGSLPDHPTEPEGVAQNAWYPGVSLLGPVDGTSTDQLMTPRSDFAVGTAERESADLELEVWCIADLLTLSVGATLNGVELDPEALTLGDGCKSNGMSADHLWFTYDLSLCGTQQSVLNGNVVVTNFLQYTPDPVDVIPEQVDVFSLPVQCTLDRLQDDESPVVMSLPGFALQTMNGTWAGVAETNVYRRGQPVHLQATVGRLEDEQQLYVQSCHATASPDPQSRPRVRLIVKKGCVAYVVSKRGRAQFVLSERTDAVNFVFTAFHFASPEIYIHCELAILEQIMTSASKFCNYNQKKQRWEELSGDIAVCSCCRTVCHGPSPGSTSPGLQALVTIGPLIVENKTTVGDAKPATSAPLLSETPVAMETTPSPPLTFPAAFPEGSYSGYAEVAAQDWAALPAPESLPYLDGMPVAQGVWGQSYGPPQGVAGCWYLVTEVVSGQNEASWKVEDSLASLQSDDGDVFQRYHRDDPSIQDSWWPGSVGNELLSDPVLEESRRKRWGVSKGTAQKLRYEEEEQGLGEEDRAMKRRVLLEEDNVWPSSLNAALRRMYKAE